MITMKPFLITGLPRSRTAWLSVVTTGPHSFCHHEPLTHTSSFEEYEEFWTKPNVPFVGISDSGIVPQLGRVLVQIEPQTLIVRRDIVQVKASLRKAFADYEMDHKIGDKYLDTCESELKKWLTHPLVRVVEFEELRDAMTVDKCIKWLMPQNDIPFNRALMDLNIQADVKKVMTTRPMHQWWVA